MAVLRICALLLLFDCQEAFHCCLVVACINRINMISIECHRSGERCPGKREFDNRIEINPVRSGEIDVAIPFKSPNAFKIPILVFYLFHTRDRLPKYSLVEFRSCRVYYLCVFLETLQKGKREHYDLCSYYSLVIGLVCNRLKMVLVERSVLGAYTRHAEIFEKR